MQSVSQIPGFSGSPNTSPIRIPSLGPPPPKLSSLNFASRETSTINPNLFVVNTPLNVSTPLDLSTSRLSVSDIRPTISPNGVSLVPMVSPTVTKPIESMEPVKLSIPKSDFTTMETISIKPVNNDVQFIQQGSTNQDIEKKLFDELGYLPLGSIKYKDGPLVVKYIEAIDHRGNMVLIDLNVDSNITVRPSDLTTIRGTNSISIPYAVRVGIHAAAGNKIAGTAYKCDDGMCVMLTDPSTLKPVDIHLTFVENPANRVVHIDDSYIAIPVIRMTDILENPTLVNEIVADSTLSIREKTKPLFIKDLQEMDNLGVKVNNEIKKNMNALNRALVDVTTSLERFERERKLYDLNPPSNKFAVDRYNLLVLNIKKRQNMFRSLIKKARDLSVEKAKLLSVITSLGSIMSDLNTNYYGVEKKMFTS